MSDKEILEHYEKMSKIYGDSLPNPEQEPIRFAHYVKMYRYYHVK